jgi:hypothetical protein
MNANTPDDLFVQAVFGDPKARVEAQLRDDERQRLLDLMRSTRLPNMAQVREALIFLLAGTK